MRYTALSVLSVIVVIAAVAFWALKEKYWIHLPALYEYLRDPIYPNTPMVWEKSTEPHDLAVIHRAANNDPNIVLILMDDLGFNDISFYGGGFFDGRIKTPNIDSIGNNGASFLNAYSGHATCAPSRAALLTGTYGSKLGFEFTPIAPAGGKVLGNYGPKLRPGIYHANNSVGVGYENMTLPEETINLAKALKRMHLHDPEAAGKGTGSHRDSRPHQTYRTIQVGKWHLGTKKSARPTAQGFDQSLGVSLISTYLPSGSPEARNCYLDDFLDEYLWANVRYIVRKGDQDHYMRPRGYITDYFAEEAAAAIEANKYSPFFLYLAFTAVHTPLQALQSDYDSLAQYDDMNHCDKVYAAMLLSIDRAVGTVLKALEASGVRDNTIVMFTSDNGGPNYIEQRHLNSPYRGWKASFFEGGIRTPLLMQWPKQIEAGTVVRDALVSHVDIFPTMLAAARVPYTHSISGTNLLPLILEASHHQRELNVMVASGASATDEERHYPIAEGQNRAVFFRSGHYKAIVHRGRGRHGEFAPPLGVEGVVTGAVPAAPPVRCEVGTHQHHNLTQHAQITACRDSIPLWKLQSSQNPSKIWLFDLLNDPTEQHNLAEDVRYASILHSMQAALDAENADQAAHPIWESRSETACFVDKLMYDTDHQLSDEYVYWPN